MKELKNHKQLRIASIVLFYFGLSLAMYFFYRRDFVWCGDDIYYHFQRIMGLSGNFSHGLLFSNISPMNFGKIGYGVNVFYPWLTMLPFKFTYSITGDWISSFYLALLFYFFISLLISHYSMKKFSGSTKLAVLFAIIYNFSNYRLIELFTRSAIAEYIASIFIPLVFLGFYEVFFKDEKQWRDLAIGMSLIILTHVLTVFMCIMMFVLILVIFAFKLKLTKSRLLNFGKAVVSTILATTIFTVPFLAEEAFQKYGVPDRQILKGQDLGQLVVSSLTNNARRIVENNAYNIGLFLLVMIFLGAILIMKFNSLYKILYGMFVVTFLLTTSLFPWNIFQDTPIQVIQFPYRFLMFTTLFGSIVSAQVLAIIFKSLMDKRFVVVVSIVTAVTGGLWMYSIINGQHSILLASKSRVVSQKMIKKGIEDTYLEQYVPKDGQEMLYTVKNHLVDINGSQSNQTPVAIDNGNDFYFADVKKGDVINLPYVRYKYTKAQLNGQEVPVEKSNRATAQVVAPENYQQLTVHMSYGDRKLSFIIFFVSLVTWVWVLFGPVITKYRKTN